MPMGVYILAGVLGSLLGAVLDAVLYPDGGSMFLKIGLVAGPSAVWGLSRLRKGPEQGEE